MSGAYFVRDFDGIHFNLSSTRNGPALRITDDGGSFVFNYRPAIPPKTDWPAFGTDYVLIMRAAEAWANALGITGFTGLLNDAD